MKARVCGFFYAYNLTKPIILGFFMPAKLVNFAHKLLFLTTHHTYSQLLKSSIAKLLVFL